MQINLQVCIFFCIFAPKSIVYTHTQRMSTYVCEREGITTQYIKIL